MKTIIISIFLFLTIKSYSQMGDILIVPKQSSIVISYNGYGSPIGLYVGGYYNSSFPYPYIYTSYLSYVNRIGLNVVTKNRGISFMGGGFIENFNDSISVKPDLWIKINPIRVFAKNKSMLDFSFGLNYMNGFHYGVGLSIPFRGIY